MRRYKGRQGERERETERERQRERDREIEAEGERQRQRGADLNPLSHAPSVESIKCELSLVKVVRADADHKILKHGSHLHFIFFKYLFFGWLRGERRDWLLTGDIEPCSCSGGTRKGPRSHLNLRGWSFCITHKSVRRRKARVRFTGGDILPDQGIILIEQGLNLERRPVLPLDATNHFLSGFCLTSLSWRDKTCGC
jgi:hypothetical protein